MDATLSNRSHHREPWNKGGLIGQKAPFKRKDIWAMRVRLQQQHRSREPVLLNLGIDSKLRGCDLVSLKVRDITDGDQVASRAIVLQKKTGRPVQLEVIAKLAFAMMTFSRQAGFATRPTSAPGGTHVAGAPSTILSGVGLLCSCRTPLPDNGRSA